DVSVSAVRYRAFVFAAPPYFVAGNRPPECRGAVSVCAVCLRAATPARILTVPLRGCPVAVSCVPGQGKQTSGGRIILSRRKEFLCEREGYCEVVQRGEGIRIYPALHGRGCVRAF